MALASPAGRNLGLRAGYVRRSLILGGDAVQYNRHFVADEWLRPLQL
jgi:hypothetical protein